MNCPTSRFLVLLYGKVREMPSSDSSLSFDLLDEHSPDFEKHQNTWGRST